jgi:hypothetical protein
MIRQALVPLAVVVLHFPAMASAQQSIIASSRSIDWRSAGVPGDVQSRTTICSTLGPDATADQISGAIAACPAGQVVKLTAGTYNLSAGIRFGGKSDVTLRGAGPDQTFLVFASSDACMGQGGNICVNGSDLGYYVGGPAHSANWTAGYDKGATQITLSNTTGLTVGMYIVLDQLNDTADTGNVLVCSKPQTCADEGPGGGGRPNREQEQFVKVTAINGHNVTVTPGLHMPNWRSSQSPGAFWGNPSSMVSGAGVEDLSIDNAATTGKSAVYFIFAINSWAKNIRSLNSNRNHVWIYESAHITVRDSYFYGTQRAASQSYGIEEYMASDNLIQNNILHHIATPLQTNQGTGSVFAYNYTFDDYYGASPAWQQASSYLHAAGVDMVLHEGNEGTGFTGDDVHGSHNFVTAFRNYLIGQEPGKTTQTNPVKLYAFNRYMNFVGNVLGTSGYHDSYEWNVSGAARETSIFNLGSDTSTGPSDPLVRPTLLRWGNYDTVSGTARFLASEIPVSLTPYGANPVPSDTTLPASLYLSAKPAWWGAVPWPAIGPDVTGGPGPGGHAYRIPAHVCYDNTSRTNGILNFNAAHCYASGTAPAAPPNLRIIG